MRFLVYLCICLDYFVSWSAVYFLKTLQRFTDQNDRIGIRRTFVIAGTTLWFGIFILIFIILDILHDLAAIF